MKNGKGRQSYQSISSMMAIFNPLAHAGKQPVHERQYWINPNWKLQQGIK
ncbi:MAG: hypothetical protein LCH54_13675 [Bacteroidetes bacterium]|nr:hypothetical protein [Bacteroidota bacterium]